MKKIKKNIALYGLILSLVLGVIFSFIPKNINADNNGEGGFDCYLDGYWWITPVLYGGSWALLCNCDARLGEPGIECNCNQQN